MEIGGRISQANGRLKSSLVRVRIEQIGHKLYLKATLPPRPGSTTQTPHQQRIALGIGAHPKGLSMAEKEARIVGSLLEAGKFEWMPYLFRQGRDEPDTAGQWLNRFEAEFKHTVEPVTWKTEYQCVFKTLDAEQPLTVDLLRKAIDQTKANTKNRKRFCVTLGRLAKFAGLDVDFNLLQGNYSASCVEPRDLPSDELIVKYFYELQNLGWRYVYGMMATFGLRNHEVFYLDTEDLESGKSYMIKILESKTGPHSVWACYPEWVDEFGLRNRMLPPVTGKEHSDYTARVTNYLGPKLPFHPLDLRHRWAIRTLEFGLPWELAAKQMGHSNAVHERTYHRWITDEVHQRAFDAIMMRSDRPKPPCLQ
ncbi:MAG: site-specific integrase [Elainellaceae cyanobacterium]